MADNEKDPLLGPPDFSNLNPAKDVANINNWDVTFGPPKLSPPSTEGQYYDPASRKSMGQESAISSIYAPSAFQGFLEGFTFLFDIPTKLTGMALGKGFEGLGAASEYLGADSAAQFFKDKAPGLSNPLTLGDIAKVAFEAPATIETAITGQEPTFTKGFDATPSAARNSQERFFKDMMYVAGGATTAPAALLKMFGLAAKPVTELLEAASGRTTNSESARAILAEAQAKHLTASQALKAAPGPNAVRALGEAARQYAAKHVIGLGKAPLQTLGKESAYGVLAGVGYGAPELLSHADKDGRIMMDLGEDMGSVDVMPSLKVLSSMGLPIVLAHGPTGVALSGASENTANVLKWVINKGRSFGTSLIGGVSEKGVKDLATRIFMAMQSDPTFFDGKFLQAVENGAFMKEISGPFTPIKILEDGSIIPQQQYSFGGIVPDTLQLAKQLGVSDPKMSLLDGILSGRSGNAYARLGEEARRAQSLENTFDLLKANISGGDESATFRAMEKIKENLDRASMEGVEDAVGKAREVYRLLEPEIGGAEASRLAVDQLHQAKARHQQIRQELWDKDLVGTDFVDTRSFGDWAASQISDTMTARTQSVTRGMGVLYKIAGKERLEKLGFNEAGKPLTKENLQGVKGEGDTLLDPSEIGPKGLFDLHGTPGSVTSLPVKIHDLDKFRSEMGNSASRARNSGDAPTARRFDLIVEHIDNQILTEQNISKKWLGELDQSHLTGDDLAAWREYVAATPSAVNLRNIKIAREHAQLGFERFGPTSEIGRALFRGKKPVAEEFLKKFLLSGEGSGKRVDLFRNALNEPQRVLEGDKVTWVRDPEASLSLGDNPSVIEAELLRRFTTSFTGKSATQRNIDSFLTKYGEAVDQVPGLRSKFNDLEGLQQSVDAMAAKLTTPTKDSVKKALLDGATADDVLNAQRILRDTLGDEQLKTVASEFLGKNADSAAYDYITGKIENMPQSAEQIHTMLSKGPPEALEGFRSALFRAVRDFSKRVDADTGQQLPESTPGIWQTQLKSSVLT